MLNPFPELLIFSLLAPFIIRVALGLFFLFSGFSLVKKLFRKREEGATCPLSAYLIGWISIAGGLPVFIGFFTQIGALILGILSLYLAFSRSHSRPLYLLLFAMSLSLLFSGAGFLALDLPL